MSVAVLGVEYTIELEQREGFHGGVDKGKKVITLSHGDDEGEFFNTLVHELAHAVLHESKIDRQLSTDLEEMIVWHFADFFCEFFA